MDRKPEIGEQVEVPWGFEYVPGVIRELYGPPGRPMVLVDVIVPGAESDSLEEVRLSFPLDVVKSTGSSSRGKRQKLSA